MKLPHCMVPILRLAVYLTMALALSPCILARKVRTRVTPPNRTETAAAARRTETLTVMCDTLTEKAPYSPSMLRFEGYAKEASANRESFYITNSTDRTITSVTLEVSYSTGDGKPLHRRRVTVDTEVPSGQRRMADIPAWDRQHLYYHVSGNRPRKKATPYEVAFRVVSFTLR